MNNANRVTKFHDIFDVFVTGCCDGMLNNRPIEVKSVSILNSEKVMRNLASIGSNLLLTIGYMASLQSLLWCAGHSRNRGYRT